MKIYEITDPIYASYGRIVDGYDTSAIVEALKTHTPIPEGVDYVPEEPALQNLKEAQELAPTLFGGLEVEFGWCNGHNTKLNCLEYHRSSEFNLGATDFVMLLAQQSDIKDHHLDTSTVKAFRVPAGVLVETYATSLHYAPCQAFKDSGFQVMIGLPKGTNVKPEKTGGKSTEDPLLVATNKWLLAHADSAEAQNGAVVGLDGINIDIMDDLK